MKKLNERYQNERELCNGHSNGIAACGPEIACYVPLDGYHLTRAQLAAMPNPEEAAYRRGAPFTFDGEKYFSLVKQLRERILPESTTIKAPSFDHAKKDPVENDILIRPTDRIVVLEGLYVALDEESWRDAANLMNELWFVDVPMDVAVKRLVSRHVAAGLSPDVQHARTRVMASDMRNGQQLLDHRLPVQEVIPSFEDKKWVSQQSDSQVLEVAGNEKRENPARAGTLGDLAMNGGGC